MSWWGLLKPCFGKQVFPACKLLMSKPMFESTSPYKDGILALPVTDLDAASAWYSKHFGMTEIERHELPHPVVILERDGV